MSISSSDILNLSHALKDICEVDCCTCPLLTQTLRLAAQSNLLQAHIQYSRTLAESCFQDGRKRQEGFNLNYIHEHPRENYDRDLRNCDSENCD